MYAVYNGDNRFLHCWFLLVLIAYEAVAVCWKSCSLSSSSSLHHIKLRNWFFSPSFVMAMPKICISNQLILPCVCFTFHSFWFFFVYFVCIECDAIEICKSLNGSSKLDFFGWVHVYNYKNEHGTREWSAQIKHHRTNSLESAFLK